MPRWQKKSSRGHRRDARPQGRSLKGVRAPGRQVTVGSAPTAEDDDRVRGPQPRVRPPRGAGPPRPRPPRDRRPPARARRKTGEGIRGGGTPSSASAPRPLRMIVLRHSDSCTEDASLKDHDRPLTAWGRSAAAALCERVVDAGWADPDLVLCSASTRSRETLAGRCRRCTRRCETPPPSSWARSTPSPLWTADGGPPEGDHRGVGGEG